MDNETGYGKENVLIEHIRKGILMGKFGHEVTEEQIERNLALTPTERLQQLEEANKFLWESDCEGARKCREMLRREKSYKEKMWRSFRAPQ